MRIAYNSVFPLCNSGYGRCCRELVYWLAQEHDVDVFAYYGLQKCSINLTIEGRLGDVEIKVYGGDGTINHPMLPRMQDKYDVIVAHWDLWMGELTGWVKSLRKPVLWWAIVDHEPLPFPVRRLLAHPNIHAVPMTKWGADVIRKAGFDCLQPIPHGVSEEFRQVNGGIKGIPDDAFVVMSVVSNTGMRENIPTMIEGFAQFLRETEADAYYFLCTDMFPSRSGYFLADVIHAIEELYGVKLKDRVLFRRDELPEQELIKAYSRADVQLMTIMGGSFELPILEAARCNTPSIVTAFSAPFELVGDPETQEGNVITCERGIAVKPVAYVWMNLASARQAQVNPADVASAIEEYYFTPRLKWQHVKAMNEWIDDNATWPKVGEKWLEVLNDDSWRD